MTVTSQQRVVVWLAVHHAVLLQDEQQTRGLARDEIDHVLVVL